MIFPTYLIYKIIEFQQKIILAKLATATLYRVEQLAS